MHRTASLLLLIALTLLPGVAAPAPARADSGDAGARSARFLLQEAVRIRRDGGHHELIKALRHLGDPALRPFFERLAASSHPGLQVHGLLGLAELSPERQLELTRMAEVEEPVVQAELITAAMDADLLPAAEARQLLSWKGLDLSVKVLIASRLIEQNAFDQPALLHEALASDTAGRRALAALLLHQLGDAAGAPVLDELNAAKDGERDVIRAMLLQTAGRHAFTRVGPWAHAIAIEPGVAPALGHLALRTAMRLGEPRASKLWRQRYDSAGEPAEQVRLALLALRLSPWLDPALFEPLTASDDPLIAQIGRAGRAVAANDPRLAEQVVPLLLMHHPLVNAWAIDYAHEVAQPQDAQLILLGLIRAFDQGPAKTRMQRLEHTIDAVRLLVEDHPRVASQLLGPLLTSDQTSRLLRQAILLGLVRARGDVSDVVANLPPFSDADTQSLALLIKAKSPLPLSASELKDLELLVRGGGNLQDNLRAQAAWAYLVRTEQASPAVAAVSVP